MNTNKSVLPVTLVSSALCYFLAVQGRTQEAGSRPARADNSAFQAYSIESMPPVVVKTVPESGAKDVAPGIVEIKVTFSKEMADQSWSWSTAWQNSSPTMLGKPRYEPDQKTCVVRAQLEPNKTYAYWLNSARFQNFRDQQSHPAVPYLLIFQTKGN